MKRLFFVRHGETEMNVANIWSGQIETPLTAAGRAQAKKTGRHVKTSLPQIDLIVSSPLSRAHHTAEIIAAEVGYPVDEIVQSELLVERSFGVLEGVSSANYYDQNSFEDLDAVEQSETVAEVQARAQKALEFVETLKGDNILVVSHGTFGRAFRRAVEKLPHTHEYDEHHRKSYRMANAEIVELL